MASIVEILFRGHADVRATDPQALELVMGDEWASRSRAIGYAPQYDPQALLALRGRVKVSLSVGGLIEIFEATISPDFLRNSPIIFRREPAAARVFAIQSTKGAADLSTAAKLALRARGAQGSLSIEPLASVDLPKGLLVLVGMPIGSQGDLSPRALDMLSSVDLILCEDTRIARDALGWRGLKTRLESCYAQNETVRSDELARRLEEGQRVAYVSDAGMPTISDPGAQLVRAARSVGALVTSAPGPSAVTMAFAISGISGGGFSFVGFPARKGAARRTFVSRVLNSSIPSVLFEAPGRLLDLLRALAETAPERELAVCRDLTKQSEAVFRGTVEEVLGALDSGEAARGEYTLVVAGSGLEQAEPGERAEDDGELERFIKTLVEEDCPIAPIVTALRARGVNRRDAYDLVQRLKSEAQAS